MAMTALITGGASGIGAALATQLRAVGWKVYTLDQAANDHPDARQADVRDPQACIAALDDVPHLDLLVCNAGVMRRGDLFTSAPEDGQLLFDVNVLGTWHVLRAAAPHLHPQAQVLLVSSGHALDLPANPGLYGLTKWTLLGLARLLQTTRPTWTVKVVCPGPIDTPLAFVQLTAEQAEQKRATLRSPEELAQKIVTLISGEDRALIFHAERWTEEFSPQLPA
jgi:NAD(P)-dependent dehydrogenase (short-subunit alcohol dehydrogenase family)